MKKIWLYFYIVTIATISLLLGMLYQGHLDSRQFEEQQKTISELRAAQEANQKRFETLCGRQDKLPEICQNLDGDERLPLQEEYN